MTRKRLGILIIGLLIVSACVFGKWLKSRESAQEYGVFGWSEALLAEKEWTALEACRLKTGIKEVYQVFPDGFLEEEDAERFMEEMSLQGLKVFALAGDAAWGLEADGASLIGVIEEAARYNEKQPKERKLRGVMADVEPYLLDEWDGGEQVREHLMKTYLSGMKAAYDRAREARLELYVCVPTFYDITCEEVLEELVREGLDGIAVMNYNREDEYSQMEAEVALARKYGKEILCIYELQEAGNHDLEEINTYAGEGLEALWASAEELKERFAYDRLDFAYHYYEPLKHLTGL